MQDALIESGFGSAVAVRPAPDAAQILLICEHGSHRVPPALDDLGLSPDILKSHIGWDPGALGVAIALAEHLQAPLVHGLISRLVYDCNRPPDAPSAIPRHSAGHQVPGNENLSLAARQARITGIYRPFHDRLQAEIAARRNVLRLLVTVHSFTPVFLGQKRRVELGLLHGRDKRFARSMLDAPPLAPKRDIRMNEPYSAADGVAHTLDKHGTRNGLLNVMLEIRNDLIATEKAQADWAAWLAPWISETLEKAAE